MPKSRKKSKPTIKEVLKTVNNFARESRKNFNAVREESRKNFNDVLEAMNTFAQDTQNNFSEIRKDLKDFKQQTNARFDSVDTRLAAMQGEIEDIRDQLNRIEKRTTEDTDVFAKDITELRKRVIVLEAQIKTMQGRAAHTL